MFYSFPDCIYQNIQEDEEWLGLNDYLTEYFHQQIPMEYFAKYLLEVVDEYCIEHYTLDFYNWCKSLVQEYCPQYLMLYDIYNNIYSQEQLLRLYDTSFDTLDIDTQYILIVSILNTYLQTEKEYIPWVRTFMNFSNKYKNHSTLQDNIHYARMLKLQAMLYINMTIDNAIIYSSDLLKNIRDYVIKLFTKEYPIELDNAYSYVPDVFIWSLNSIFAKFDTNPTNSLKIENDLVDFDWQLDQFEYQYESFDINQLKLRFTLFKFFISKHNFIKAFELLNSVCVWINGALFDKVSAYKGMLLLDTDNRLIFLSIIYIVLNACEIFPHLQLNLINLTDDDKFFILNQEFLKKSEQEEYLTRYNRKFYLRYFSDALQVVEHLRQVASVYYDKDKANEIVQMFQTLSDQLTELEEQVYQTTGSTDIPTE